MRWITREHVKVDRVACPWLIKKFVDKDAEFFFVPADKVMEEAKRLGATPFDVSNVELGHHGEDVSFNSILKKHKLTDPALQLQRRIGELVFLEDGIERHVLTVMTQFHIGYIERCCAKPFRLLHDLVGWNEEKLGLLVHELF